MDTKARASTRALVAQGASSPLRGACALLTGFFLAACGSSDEGGGGGKKDSGRDTTSTTPIDGPRTGLDTSQQQPDLGTDAPAGCVLGVQIISPGLSANVPGYCPMCVCRADGTWGNCALCDGGATSPDNRPGVDNPPAGCVQAGISYAAGSSMPRADRCPGSCICSAAGTPVNCTGGCLDSGTVTQPDTADGPKRDVVDAPPPPDVPMQPDLPIEYPVDRVDVPPIDTACAFNKPCTLTNGGQGVCTAGACVACSGATADTTCNTIYGSSGNVCVNGRCVVADCTSSSQCAGGLLCDPVGHKCVACNAYTLDAGDPQLASDNKCKGDSTYGTNFLCLSGACTRGDCHTSANCPAGEICGLSFPNVCAVCTTDAQCTATTSGYGTGYLCIGNRCVQGTCHDSSECKGATPTATGAGRICSATTHTCVDCTSDTQCQNDTGVYGADYICSLSATNHRCVSSACSNNGDDCTANTADFCCDSKCVAGDCCENTDCAANRVCASNTCTACQAVSNSAREYLVDPVNGSDSGGTGSGRASGGDTAPECAVKTVTRAIALALAGTPALSATNLATITIVGTAGSTTSLVTGAGGEDLPIAVPRYVTIRTQGGPVRLSLPDGEQGFSFRGAPSGLSPATGAALTIDKATGATTGIGIAVEPPSGGTFTGTGTVTLTNLTINNTGAAGISLSVAAPTLAISSVRIAGPGTHGVAISAGTTTMSSVTVTGAVAGDGIHVTGGEVTMTSGVQVTESNQNGLAISGGTVTINNATAGSAATLFNTNSGAGIFVSGDAILNIAGSVSGSSSTVRTQTNAGNNVEFNSTSTSTPVSSISGLYSFGSSANGLQILAGSRIRVRGSTFLGNTGSGIRIASTGTPATDLLDNIDLGTGTASSGNVRGRNTLQVASGASRNSGAGLCVAALTAASAQNLSAQANLFGAGDCVTTNPVPVLSVAATCVNGTYADLGILTATGSTEVTVDTDTCTQP